MTTAPGRAAWDLFCRVVDNYGDVGIAWRLAKQLAADPRSSVRLFVEGSDSFARIEPRLDPHRHRQTLDRIDIVRWSTNDVAFESVAAVVVELLGCGLPPRYLEAMAREAGPPVWIDFEHLSAEPWVADFHGLPSPQPRLPLVKHFFYPGFGSRTGGLLIEPALAERRAAFLADPAAATALWHRLGVPPPVEGEVRASLFAYDDAPVDALLAALSIDERRWSIVVPAGVPGAGTETRGSPAVMKVPFADQDTYDQLLWACDVNFVRGEDSFVRAQAAGRPFVWQIYQQAERAHLAKLDAFETAYEADLPIPVAAAQRALWSAWNDPSIELRPALHSWLDDQRTLRSHAERWRLRCSAAPLLIDRLLAFVDALQRHHPDRIC